MATKKRPRENAGDSMSGRRAFLASAGVGLSAATAGCLREFRSAVNRTHLEQLSVSITTQPADGDRQAIQIARRLADNLEAVGIDVSVPLRSREEFLRDILINHDFDIYVGRHPGASDPDFLYETLHSRYGEEAGWQNPFGYANTAVDDLLETQRTADGDERQEAVDGLLEAVAAEQPFVPICRPTDVRLVRTDRFDGWRADSLSTRLGYLDVERVGEANRLRGTVIDARVSKNLNPISAEYRGKDPLLDLLYDSLATREHDGTLIPWLATDWDWDGDDLLVSLRRGHTFHDGEPVTADDVAFTYRFLEDTSLGSSDVPAPTPRYRGAVAAVDSVDVEGDHELRIRLNTGEAVAQRVLTVPILPRHRWEPRAEQATVRGVRIAKGTTEALITDNVPPVGSGPFEFGDRAEREHLTLERFPDHFTARDDVSLPAASVDRLRAQIDPRSPSAISLIETGDSDITISPLEAYVYDDLEESEVKRVLETPSETFYHVGFNTRSAPFANPYVRRAVARLIDKAWLVETVFEGVAEPLATPVPDEWIPDSLAFDGVDPGVPFFGDDGDLDVSDARAAFESAGYRYDGDKLVVRE
ncbi:ABC transporter substrate-binding protein [Halobacteria archaeon AArc-curdl1]|uniref:ABC transporter substrate-binding protein n=1 Tax=Natronosalvus hydrolyticus TaxID=2979988 RepID=A0AAP2Z8N3_9EURY|nr:ABC transporter substrate-binding protein [Halobacteria archaeon AArc-curdl1]